MVSTAIKGVGTADTLMSAATAASKAGGESFNKIMTQSLSSNVSNTVKTAAVKDYSSQSNEKTDVTANTAVSEDSSQNVKNDAAEAQESSAAAEKEDMAQEVVDTKTEQAAENVKTVIKKQFGLSDEELEQFMAELGLSTLDLLQPANITDLVVNIAGVQDAVAILTDSDLSESLKSILGYLEQLLTQLDNGQALTSPKDFELLLNEAKGVVMEETAADVIVSEETVTQEEDVQTEETLQSVLESKMTVEEPADTASNMGRHQEPSENRHNANTETTFSAANNLAQSIQNVMNQAAFELEQVNSVNIVRQIVDAVKVVNNQNLQSIEIQLNPEHLGKVNLTVTARNGVITAEITAQNEQVKHAIETQMVALKEKFAEQGIKIEAVEVTVQSHSFESGQNLQGNGSEQEKMAQGTKKHLNLSSLNDLEDADLSEEETVAKNAVLNENSSVEYTA